MYRIIVLLSLFVISKSSFSQISPLEIINIYKTKANCQSYEIVGDKLFAITDSGQVVVWDLTKLPEEGTLKNFILLFNPKLTWNREPLAIGAKMSYKSLRFTEDQKLIIQTANDGFGIYDGRSLTFLK